MRPQLDKSPVTDLSKCLDNADRKAARTYKSVAPAPIFGAGTPAGASLLRTSALRREAKVGVVTATSIAPTGTSMELFVPNACEQEAVAGVKFVRGLSGSGIVWCPATGALLPP